MLSRVVFLYLALVAFGAVSGEEKLKLSFYITSRCGDTINFITRQLHPVYQELGQYMDVEFVPWGKSRRNPDDSITCQFGATDCVANKIQGCVFHLLGDDQRRMVEYAECEMRTLAATQQIYQCAIDVQVTDAKQCFDSELGDQLQRQAEAKTKTIVMIFVPTIVKDDVYDVSNQNAAFRNFKGFVCDELRKIDQNPAACNDASLKGN